MIVVILAFLASLLMSLVVIPILASYAPSIGLVDLPDNKRKLHKKAIPLVGGLGIFLTVAVITIFSLYIGTTQNELVTNLNKNWLGWLPIDFARRLIRVVDQDIYELLGLLLSSAVLVTVGMLDDRFGIRGRQKLFGQFVAATILILFGYHFKEVVMVGVRIDFDVFSVLFVYAWVIAAINSVNLLDGADGIAATIGIMMSLALAMMAIFQGQMANAIISVSIAGAVLGFLKYNFPPARVYLGDTGSMLIGLLLAAISIRCTFKQNTAYAFFAPIALLAIPFIDTAAAIIRRRLTGRSIFAVDRGHLHHSLMKRGYSPRVSLLWVAVLCLTTATGGVLSMVYEHAEYALASIVTVVVVMIVCKIFGVAEYQLVSHKAASLARKVYKGSKRPPIEQSMVHVQGSHNWKQCWEKLERFADDTGVLEVTLDLNAPWLHESYHAKRSRADKPKGGNHEWHSEVPLIAAGRLFGRVEVTGAGDEPENHHQILQKLLMVTTEIESYMVSPASPGSDAAVYRTVSPERSPATSATAALEKTRDDQDLSDSDTIAGLNRQTEIGQIEQTSDNDQRDNDQRGQATATADKPFTTQDT